MKYKGILDLLGIFWWIRLIVVCILKDIKIFVKKKKKNGLDVFVMRIFIKIEFIKF